MTTPCVPRARLLGRRAVFGVTFVGACCALLGLTELFLRVHPPKDLQPYLGASSSLSGPFGHDPDFVIGYRSWHSFREDYAQRLRDYPPLEELTPSRGTWAFFGNSFVQAQGMLADTARRELPGRPIFNLARNEDLHIRFAQIKLLVEQGLRPERLFVLLMPVDMLPLGEHPLSTLDVSPNGGRTYRPGTSGSWLEDSRLALTGWVRLGLSNPNPGFDRKQLELGLDPMLLDDVRFLFTNLARIARKHGVPVTVLLVPTHGQITRGVPCGFQDTLTPMLKELGLDVCDVREAFLRHPRRTELFIPDLHFNREGNEILLQAVLAHLKRNGHYYETRP